MAFKVFEEYGSASREQATLRASGAVFVSNAILNRTNTAEPEAARLLFDEDSKRLGIQLVKNYDRKDKSVRKMNDEKSGRSINVQPVLRFHGLNTPSKRMVFNVSLEDDMIVLDLSSLVAGRRGRKPKQG